MAGEVNWFDTSTSATVSFRDHTAAPHCAGRDACALIATILPCAIRPRGFGAADCD
jgi:hypothetical protein